MTLGKEGGAQVITHILVGQYHSQDDATKEKHHEHHKEDTLVGGEVKLWRQRTSRYKCRVLKQEAAREAKPPCVHREGLSSSTPILLFHGNCFICISGPIAQHPSVQHAEPDSYHIPFIATGKNSVPIAYLISKSLSYTFVPVPFCTLQPITQKNPKPKPTNQKKPAYPHTLASSSPIYTPDTSLTPASALIFL